MMVLSCTGISIFNSLQYWALEYTEALNALLIQSSGPLFIAIWSLLLLGVRLTWAQAFGILVSLCGVLTILLLYMALSAMMIRQSWRHSALRKASSCWMEPGRAFSSLYTGITVSTRSVRSVMATSGPRKWGGEPAAGV